MNKKIEFKNLSLNSSELFIIAGPCVIEEDFSIFFSIAKKLKEITSGLNLPFIFKASYDKANRTSIDSYRGVGIKKGLEYLSKIKEELDLPILTDIHRPEEAEIAAKAADIIQIPAFLCRQTDILVAAAKTGKIINIKKGQFLAPKDIDNSAKKVINSGNNQVIITERGSSFGYNNLVSDMRAIPIVKSLGYPIIFDATHSVQLPGGAGKTTSGQREFIGTLAKAAVASGCNGLFFETHLNPDNSPCDGPNMIKLEEIEDLLKVCKDIYSVVNKPEITG